MSKPVARTARPPSRLTRWLLKHRIEVVQPGPGAREEPGAATPLVAGRLPDRGGLLLDARLHTGHRSRGGRSLVADSHHAHSFADALRRAPHVPHRRRTEPPWAGIHRDAREPALVLEGQALRPVPARFRRHRLGRHDHPVGLRRHRPHRREPVLAGVPGRRNEHAGRRHAAAGGAAGCCLLERFPGSNRHRRGDGRSVPPAQPRRCHRWLLRDIHPTRGRRGLAGSAVRHPRRPALDAGRRRRGVPAPGPRALGVRDRRRHDAPRARRPRRRPRSGLWGGSATPARCSPSPP